MKSYHTVVVGTDGSDTSLRAVDRAASVAAASDAKLVIVSAYRRQNDPRAADLLKDEAYLVQGAAPTYATLRVARDRATAAGVKSVEERAMPGGAVGVLVDVADQVHADLLVVGDAGLGTLSGRIFGSVPRAVRRRAKTETLIVPTTN